MQSKQILQCRMKRLCVLCAQWSVFSDCADAQTDLNLHRANKSEGTFSDVQAEMSYYILLTCQIVLPRHQRIDFVWFLVGVSLKWATLWNNIFRAFLHSDRFLPCLLALSFGQPAQPHSVTSLRIPHISVSGTTAQSGQSSHTSNFGQPAQPHSVIRLGISQLWISRRKHSVISLRILHISVNKHNHTLWSVFANLIFRLAGASLQCDLLGPPA